MPKELTFRAIGGGGGGGWGGVLSIIPLFRPQTSLRSPREPTHLGMAGNALVDAAQIREVFQVVGLGQGLIAQHGRDGLEEVHVIYVSISLGESARKFSPHLQDTKNRISPNKRKNPNERRKQHAAHCKQDVIAYVGVCVCVCIY